MLVACRPYLRCRALRPAGPDPGDQQLPGLVLLTVLQACFHHAKQFIRTEIACQMLTALEGYYWRYCSALELVNMILAFIGNTQHLAPKVINLNISLTRCWTVCHRDPRPGHLSQPPLPRPVGINGPGTPHNSCPLFTLLDCSADDDGPESGDSRDSQV